MASMRQIEANRSNAQFSSGPKTGPGKVAASKNALRHGLLSKEALLPGESSTDFFEFIQKLHAELRPVGELECALVGRIGSLLWRLKRMGKLEAGILMWEQASVDPDTYGRSETLERASVYDRTVLEHGEAYMGCADSLSKLSRYETSLERSLYKTLHELQRLQAARQGEPVPAPVVIDVNVDETTDAASSEK